MEDYNESSSIAKMNLVEQELCSRSASFDWLSDEKRDLLPGPIAFEYKRLREYTEKGNVEASLWKLVNLANVTLSYLFAAVLEGDNPMRKDLFNGQNPSVRFKREEILGSRIGRRLRALLTAIKNIIDWRNDYGTGHGVLLNQSYYISDNILQYYIDFLRFFKPFPDILDDANLSLRAVIKNEKTGEQVLLAVTGANYFDKIRDVPWGTWLVCNTENCVIKQHEAPVRFFGYQFDLPDIYFVESVFEGEKENFTENKILKTYRNYSKNRIKKIVGKNSVAWNDEPRQVAWLSGDEREEWWTYYKRVTKNNKYYNGDLINIIADASEKFQLLGRYDKAIISASAVLKHSNKNDPAVNLRANLAMYSAEFAKGNSVEANKHLLKAKSVVSKVKKTNMKTGVFLNAQISAQESWNIGLSRKKEDIKSALNICDNSISELDKSENEYPFSALMAKLELRKNKLYISRNCEGRNSHKLRNESLEVLKETRRLYQIDPENRRTVDIYGFACNLYRRHTCDLIDQGKLDQNEVGEVEKIIDEGLEIRKKSLDSYDMDIWSVRGEEAVSMFRFLL